MRNIYPKHNRLSIINIPHTILSHYGIKPFKSPLPKNLTRDLEGTSNIILFLIDGFGMNLFKKVGQKNDLFKTVIRKKKIFSIKTVFPPSTPPALTSLNTGLSPKEHGLIEWFLYFEEVNAVIKTIPYEIVDNKMKKSLPNNPGLLFKGKTIFEFLAEKGVGSYCFVPNIYKNSMYTKTLMKGGNIIAYGNLNDLMKKLSSKVEIINNSYVYVYIPYVDEISHSFGPDSMETLNEVENLGKTIQDDFLNKITKSAADKLGFILVSDHGQKQINPLKILFLNEHPEIIKNLKRYKGKTIYPTGNPHNVFLSVKEDKIKETMDLLKKLLINKARVILLNKASTELLFGKGHSHSDFLKRVGNILILPNRENTVWHKFFKKDEFNLLGHHGGTFPETMNIPLVISKASDLINSQ